MSLRLRVALASALTTVLVVVLAGGTLLAFAARDQRDDLDEQLRREVEVVSNQAALVPPGNDRQKNRLERVASNLNISARVVNDSEVTLTVGDFPLADDEEVPLGFSTVDGEGGRWRVLAVDRGPAVVEVATPTSGVEQTLSSLRRALFRIGIVSVGVAALAGWLLGAAALRPLARLRRDAESVSALDGGTMRVAEDQGLPEVDALGRSLNLMLDRIRDATDETEVALEASRSFAANAAHELRTPLTSMKANLDVLERNPDLPPDERSTVVAELLDQEARLLELLEALRLLARGDLTGVLPDEEVDVGELVGEAVSAATRRHPDAEITRSLEGDQVVLRGWHEGLRVMVDNLLANACHHGRRDGEPARVAVSLTNTERDLQLVVDDSGPGVPPAERATVLERFGRGSTVAKGGSGLGLALVDQQARLHGGEVTLADSPSGGLRVAIRLPLTRNVGPNV